MARDRSRASKRRDASKKRRDASKKRREKRNDRAKERKNSAEKRREKQDKRDARRSKSNASGKRRVMFSLGSAEDTDPASSSEEVVKLTRRNTRRNQAASGLFEINVRALTGETYALEVSGSYTIFDVKEQLAEEADTDPMNMRLIYGGMQLEDGNTVSSYGLQAGSTLHVVMRQSTTQSRLMMKRSPFGGYGVTTRVDSDDSEASGVPKNVEHMSALGFTLLSALVMVVLLIVSLTTAWFHTEDSDNERDVFLRKIVFKNSGAEVTVYLSTTLFKNINRLSTWMFIIVINMLVAAVVNLAVVVVAAVIALRGGRPFCLCPIPYRGLIGFCSSFILLGCFSCAMAYGIGFPELARKDCEAGHVLSDESCSISAYTFSNSIGQRWSNRGSTGYIMIPLTGAASLVFIVAKSVLLQSVSRDMNGGFMVGGALVKSSVTRLAVDEEKGSAEESGPSLLIGLRDDSGDEYTFADAGDEDDYHGDGDEDEEDDYSRSSDSSRCDDYDEDEYDEESDDSSDSSS